MALSDSKEVLQKKMGYCKNSCNITIYYTHDSTSHTKGELIGHHFVFTSLHTLHQNLGQFNLLGTILGNILNIKKIAI